MARTENPGIIISITATGADLARSTFVDFNGATCAAGSKALGVANVDTGVGRQAPVALNGVLLIKAGAAIAAGAEVQSDANGAAITKTANGASNGFALDAATAAGEIIRIVRGI